MDTQANPQIVPNITDIKPKLRGWIHAGTFPVAIALGVVLIVFARGAAAITGAAVFMATSLLLFGVSALYHRIGWTPNVKAVFRRIDHANIFLLIAGTYTPLSLMLLPRDKAIVLLALVWTGAIAGVFFRIFWLSAPRALYVVLYLLLGWSAMIYVTDLFRASWITMTLVLIGGVLYSLGAAVYGFKKPNPCPTWFGFHEIFHSLTVAAFLCQWTGVFIAALQTS
ncbi:MAG: hemolysin III family protein [Thermomicrobiales bacterium]|nr:hemolysin III family protein [Thermomicrobiales bacterium]